MRRPRTILALTLIALIGGLLLARRDRIGPPLPPGKVRPQLEGWGDIVLLAPDGTLWQWGMNFLEHPRATRGRWSFVEQPTLLSQDADWAG